MALMSKYFLGGLSLTGLSTGFIFYEKEDRFSSREQEVIDNSEGEEKPEELIRGAGLKCDEENRCWADIWSRRRFNVEREKKEENLAFGYGAKGYLKKHEKSEKYPGGLRFTVEGSDIPLRSRRIWMGNSVFSLKEYENYEIKREGKKYYLSRTKNSSEGKILELGLPGSCTLPVTGEITCTVLHVEEVEFEGGLNGLVDGETSLTISKTEDKSFREGYKFTFTFPQDVNIGDKVIKAKSPTDFRLKRNEKNGHLTLERAWANEKDLLNRVGLECGAGDICSLKSGETLKIKKAESQEPPLEISNISPGRIKLYKDDDYFSGLKLQVEGEKIVSGDNTLEEFETYEIKEEGDKYYLLLKKNPEERIRELLKYPCSLSTNCTIPNERSLKAINFEGKEENLLSLEKKMVKITVSKTSEENYPLGWKFSIASSEDLSISSSNFIKANAPTDFKLKKHDNGNLTLERAWASENELAGKAGLSCDSDNNCTINSGGLQVRKEEKNFQISSIPQESKGKIKLSKETSGYSNGLKFEIEKGKIGTGDEVLEEFETYEIKEIGGKYYLVLKTKAEKQMKKLLKFPTRCFDSSECNISNQDEFKDINFEGKDENLMTLQSGKTLKITVSNAPEKDFPFSRKFTLTSTGEIKISNSTTVNANAPTDFKLKNNEGSLSLEKVWSSEDILINKVGLECTDDNCSLKTGETLNINKGGKEIQFSSLPEEGGKIKLYRNSGGYSNSLKFAVEEGNIGTGDQILEEFETYEIKGDRSKYYLGLKGSAEEKIKELLKYPTRCSLSTSSACDNLKEVDIKNINFKDKNEGSMTLGNKTVKITVYKTSESDFPLGRRFKIESTGDLNISDTTSVKANIPTEFKINKGGSGQSATLSLEKAWTLETLAKKVGLKCEGDGSCTIITENNLNVKTGGKLFEGISESEQQGEGGIKVIEGQAGYNEGFKFQIQGGNINLSASEDQNIVLEEFETYEIKNSKGVYYLERKKSSLEGKWEALGLPDKCLKYYDNKTHGCPIVFDDLKNIKFYGKDTKKSITVGNAQYWLKTSSESNFPLGIKVKMEVNKNHEVRIPKEKGGSIILWKEFETEFRVKKEGDGYSLENTVDMNELVKKFGITSGNCDDELGCTIGTKVNVYMSGTQYRRNAGVSASNEKITYRWGKMKEKGFSEDLVFRVSKKGIKLSSNTGEHTKSSGFFNSIEEGNYVIKTSTVGSDNHGGTVIYLYKENARMNYDPSDSFFA